jgi:hypothetical protein
MLRMDGEPAVDEGSSQRLSSLCDVFSDEANIDESGCLVVVGKEMRNELELAPTVPPEDALKYSCTVYLSSRILFEPSGHMLSCALPL